MWHHVFTFQRRTVHYGWFKITGSLIKSPSKMPLLLIREVIDKLKEAKYFINKLDLI